MTLLMMLHDDDDDKEEAEFALKPWSEEKSKSELLFVIAIWTPRCSLFARTIRSRRPEVRSFGTFTRERCVLSLGCLREDMAAVPWLSLRQTNW